MAKTLLTMEVNKTDGGYGGMSVLTADGETARTVGYAIGTAIKRANNLAEQVIDQMKDDTIRKVKANALNRQPRLDLRTHTVAQFVAEFFGSHGAGIDYSTFSPAPCWNGYVGWVADAGAILEDAVQAHIKEGSELAQWYDVIEETAKEFRDLLVADGAPPDPDALSAIFYDIVGQHLEK